MDNVRTIMIDMPTTIRSYVIYRDDYYTIVINASLTHEAQVEAYRHELHHITSGDCESKAPAGILEIFAHSVGRTEYDEY